MIRWIYRNLIRFEWMPVHTILEPEPLFDLRPIGATFYISAKIDRTIPMHLLGGMLAAVFVNPIWVFMFLMGLEVNSGISNEACTVSGCDQGHDTFDALANVTAMIPAALTGWSLMSFDVFQLQVLIVTYAVFSMVSFVVAMDGPGVSGPTSH